VKIWRERKGRYKYLGQTGRVVSWSRIMTGNYWVVMVEFGKKDRTVGQLVGKKKPKIGDKVIGVVRRLRQPGKEEVIEYGVKFKYE